MLDIYIYIYIQRYRYIDIDIYIYIDIDIDIDIYIYIYRHIIYSMLHTRVHAHEQTRPPPAPIVSLQQIDASVLRICVTLCCAVTTI